MVDYWNGMNYVKKYLNLPPWPVDGFSFVRFRPGKPKWMHESTYQRHLIRLSRYQLRHGKRLAEDLARLFR